MDRQMNRGSKNSVGYMKRKEGGIYGRECR